MKQSNFSQSQMDSLIAMAGKKMGKDPEKIKEQMKSGEMDGLIDGLPAQKQEQIRNLINNPQAMEQFMQNPKLQQLLRGLMGK